MMMACTGQEATARKWLELTGCPICEGYGLSETSPSATCNPTDTDRYSGTIGLPLPSTEIAILDDEGGRVALGERGEIAIRGPQVMQGYWNQPEETARTLRDGWLHTGDIGRFDADGYLEITDRKKDMILVSGFNVYPAEVERVLDTHPAIAESAVIGVPDPQTGAAVRAVVDVPLIASGGAGRAEDFPPAVAAGADAVLAASVFHFGTLRVSDVKQALAAAGYPVRMTPINEGTAA